MNFAGPLRRFRFFVQGRREHERVTDYLYDRQRGVRDLHGSHELEEVTGDDDRKGKKIRGVVRGTRRSQVLYLVALASGPRRSSSGGSF